MRKLILVGVAWGLAVSLLNSGSSSRLQTQPESGCTVTIGPGESIQTAIDQADERTVICLAEGTWEENLVIRKSLTLRGVDRDKSILKGLKAHRPVILIESDAEIEVTVESLTIAKAIGSSVEWLLSDSHGLLLGGRAKATIEGNTIAENDNCGIFLRDSAQGIIKGNEITGNKFEAIFLKDLAQANVENNTIQENRGCAIYASLEATVTGASNHLKANGVDLCGNVPAFLYNPLVPETTDMEIRFPGRYGSVQEAIDAVARGGTIIIEAGEHTGGLTIWKPLTLKGAGERLGTLKGRTNQAPVISIIAEAENVRVEGLTIRGGRDGILVYSSVSVQENTISGNGQSGIRQRGLAQTTIQGNKILFNQSGIVIKDSARAIIEGNTISENRWVGIGMGGSAHATVEGNTISWNWEGIRMWDSASAIIRANTIRKRWIGIHMWDSAQATIEGNAISENGDKGISLCVSSQAVIHKNTISGNRDGIYMEGSAQATIAANTITSNTNYGVVLYQQPCFPAILKKFKGAVRGSVNEISRNKWDVCPSPELDFLISERGGCYGALCQ